MCWKTPKCAKASKAFSNWPTIPQLYVKGEFVGGADIVRENVRAGRVGAFSDAAWRGAGACGLTVIPAKAGIHLWQPRWW
jgi:hypothetical protein